MKRILAKLKSGRGASLVFALLVFALCVLAGTAALTAASANVGRHARIEDEQRQYFSVASALELLQGQMDDKTSATAADNPAKVTVKFVEKETWTYVATATGSYEPGPSTTTYTLTIDPPNATLSTTTPGTTIDPDDLTYYQKQLVLNCVPAEWWEKDTTVFGALKSKIEIAVGTKVEKNYTITPPTAYASSLYKVTVDVKSGDGYALEMHLTADGGAYPLKVVWPGEVETETKTEITTSGDPTTDTEGTRTTTTTLTCTLKWSADDRAITLEK